MTQRTNPQGQPIGDDVPGWTGAPSIPDTPMRGRYCDVVRLTLSHADDLFRAYGTDAHGTVWTYMPVGPFDNADGFRDWMTQATNSRDPLFFAIIDKATGKAIGVASFLRIDPANGVAEVGYIAFSPLLQRTRMATEAMYLMMKRILGDLGYRRYEWKCDALNAASQDAARRLGFTYEGTFRQAVVYKGRNRDTAWFAIMDHEWSQLQAAFSRWLDPANFDASGQQRTTLQQLITTDAFA